MIVLQTTDILAAYPGIGVRSRPNSGSSRLAILITAAPPATLAAIAADYRFVVLSQGLPVQFADYQAGLGNSVNLWAAAQQAAGFAATVNGASCTFPIDPASAISYAEITSALANGDIANTGGTLSQSLQLPTVNPAVVVTLTAAADWTAFRQAAWAAGRAIKEAAVSYQAQIAGANSIAQLDAIALG